MDNQCFKNSTDIRDEAVHAILNGVESVWIYGASAQEKLADFSRILAHTVEDASSSSIEKTLTEISERLNQNVSGRNDRLKNAEKIIKFYKELIEYIDKASVILRVKQAQLIKAYNVFGKLGTLIAECISELDVFLEVGAVRLNHWAKENDNIKEAFEKRLNDLEMSRLIARQGHLQLELMSSTAQELIERISSTVENIIPLWKNQTVLLLGLKSIKQDLAGQIKANDAVAHMLDVNMDSLNNTNTKVKQNRQKIDFEKIRESNLLLDNSLKTIISVEEKNKKQIEDISSFTFHD